MVRPEHATSRNIRDTKSDVFSLGLLYFYCLNEGQHVFGQSDDIVKERMRGFAFHKLDDKIVDRKIRRLVAKSIGRVDSCASQVISRMLKKWFAETDTCSTSGPSNVLSPGLRLKFLCTCGSLSRRRRVNLFDDGELKDFILQKYQGHWHAPFEKNDDDMKSQVEFEVVLKSLTREGV